MNGRRLSVSCGWAAAATLFVIGLAPVGGSQDSPAASGRSDVHASARDDHATAIDDDGPNAFGRTLANLESRRWPEFLNGKQRFVQRWPQRGPWADAAACVDCHYRDGRGPRIHDAEIDLAHLVRLGRSDRGADPTYGVQLRRVGDGAPPPSRFTVEWDVLQRRYPSGEIVELRRPRLEVRALAYGPLDARTQLSVRVPPATFGLGLLEGIDEAAILEWSDPEDHDGDGISGRAQRVHDPSTGGAALGRFGWKAAQASLAAQAATALAEDLGVTSPLVPLASGQSQSRARLPAEPEADASDVRALLRYLRALAPPARRQRHDRDVLDGETLFASLGCAPCHRPAIATGTVPQWPELSQQTIEPYSDLLLHDMGPALADNVSEGDAQGFEWRTAPLWGLGLLRIVSPGAGLLHDGRARSAEEAILWHGGEADRARERFEALSPDRRAALLRFLASL